MMYVPFCVIQSSIDQSLEAQFYVEQLNVFNDSHCMGTEAMFQKVGQNQRPSAKVYTTSDTRNLCAESPYLCMRLFYLKL